jgi:hypothetical protein
MHPNTRALIAAAAARLTAGGTVGPVYDHSRLRYVKLSGSVGNGHVAIFDQERRCYFLGSNGSFYDHGRGVQILLRINGRTFSGFDHGDGHQFTGSLQDGGVSIYDHGESAYFNYRVEPPAAARPDAGSESRNAPADDAAGPPRAE